MNVPTVDVPFVPGGFASSALEKTHTRACLLPRFRTMRGEVARWNTETRLGWDDGFLFIEFLCEDSDAWGSMTERDAPLWQEEVVEIFLAAGESVPRLYYEIEVSPLCALFDARVTNPHGTRVEMEVDAGWNCEGLLWNVQRMDDREDWRARIAIPWKGLDLDCVPRALRANFYRIERPRSGDDEFSGWLPTGTDPPDFHRPEKFGLLRLRDFV